MFWIAFAVVLAAMFIGARRGGIFLGMAGGMGLAVLVFGLKLPPSSPPIDVMLIIMAVITAAATLQSAGGMDYLVQTAERILRKNPNRITFMAPIVAYCFTLMSGTGNVVYSILPVIAEVAHDAGVRPERPMSISVIASQQAITASPISAAMAAMVALLAPFNISMLTIMSICIPATLCGVFLGSVYCSRVGVELKDDPEYQRRLAEGMITLKKNIAETAQVEATPEAKRSVWIFVTGAILVVLFGTIPGLRPDFMIAGKVSKLSMPHTIEMVMLVIAAIMVLTCKANVEKIVSGSVFRQDMMGVIGIFGLAWMGDTLINNNMAFIKDNVQEIVKAYPWVFALALFSVGALIMSQAATTRALVPLGIALGLSPVALVATWPAVNSYFFFPNYATVIAGIAFDMTGTTRIGKYVLNHSFMMPGLIACVTSVTVGFLIAGILI